MSELEIIGVPQSTYVRTVRMALAEKGVPYKLVIARPHSPEVDAIHPFGTVPVMRHGDYTLFESKAIVTYVDRAFPGPKLFPDDPRALGLIEQWVSALNTVILPVMLDYLRGYLFPGTPDGQPDRALIDNTLPKLRAHLALLDGRASGTGHLVGSTYTYADMCLMPWLAYLRGLPESGDIIGSAPSMTRYVKLHAERPSFAATVP